MPIDTQLVGPYERLLLLEALSLSGHPPTDALAALARQAVERRLDAGTVLTEKDRPWDAVHVVVEGRVAVFQSGRRLYTAGPAETFGLLEALARADGAGLEVRAELETVTLDIRATTLFSILEDHFVMTLTIVQALARLLLAAPSAARDAIARRTRLPELSSQQAFDLVDRIRLLQTSDLFSRARVGSLAEIARQFEEFRVAPQTALWREGEPAPWLLVLLDGQVSTTSRSGFAHSWQPGTAPGALEAIAGAPRWSEAVAATAITGLRLSAERLFDAVEDDFSMAEDLLATLASQLRQQRYGRPDVQG